MLCQNYMRIKEQDGKRQNIEWLEQSQELNVIKLV